MSVRQVDQNPPPLHLEVPPPPRHLLAIQRLYAEDQGELTPEVLEQMVAGVVSAASSNR